VRFFVGLWLLCQTLLALAQSDPFPEVAAAYRVEINGAPVWSKQGTLRLPPASLTKLMTALLVLEQGQLHAVATVGRAAAAETGTHIGLRAGEKFQLQDLLAAALIASANDACHALTDALAGSEARFVQRMNQRAGALGMRDTHFVNACGHDAMGHYSSAQDLALLAHELIKHPLVTELTAKTEARIATLDGARSYEFKSSNALIGRYAGAMGLKTGYTPKAGKCLVAYVERGKTRLLLVLLHGKDRWWDAVDILDLAFARALNPA
jgi:D-alanyl-D-alanine carboxypeptidase (penicillin-binding protein 5/6)